MLRLAQLSLLVRDYDEAIHWFTTRLGFELLEDTPLANGKRWVVVAPPGAHVRDARFLLARASGDAQVAAIGRQCGGRVFLFLHTDDFARDHARFLAAGVHFIEQPRHEPFGMVAVFNDLYGNPWDLIEARPPAPS